MVAFASLASATTWASDQAARDPSEPIVVPLAFKNNFPLLKASVEGVEVTLKFDLGDSDPLILQESVLKQIGATPTGAMARGRGVDGPFEAPLYRVARLQIGPATFHEVMARTDVRAGDYRSGESGEHGYLGTGLLKGYVLVIDYPNRTMTLITPTDLFTKANLCSGSTVPFLPEWNGEAVTEATTDWGRAILWWDTGAPVSALRKSFVLQAHPKLSGEVVSTTTLVLGGKNLGPFEFQVWDMNPPKFDGFIGFEFFDRHVVCVDFPGKKLVIGESPDSPGPASDRQ